MVVLVVVVVSLGVEHNVGRTHTYIGARLAIVFLVVVVVVVMLVPVVVVPVVVVLLVPVVVAKVEFLVVVVVVAVFVVVVCRGDPLCGAATVAVVVLDHTVEGAGVVEVAEEAAVIVVDSPTTRH